MDRFERTVRLLGDGALLLKDKHVALFGVGGVGGHVAEALARSGVGKITLIDNDKVSKSNINRQIVALTSTIGRYKTEVMAERIKDIWENCEVITKNIFYLPGNDEIDFSEFDYVIDAVDTVSAKIAIIENAKNAGVSVISSMGTGNKVDPTAFRIENLKKTSVCPLARVMRRELKKRGIEDVTVLYSKEEPIKTSGEGPASSSFCPSVAGLIIAGHVIKELVKSD